MILSDEEKLSEWAFEECDKGNNSQKMRKLITDQFWIYMYCKHIQDRENMWRKIRSPRLATWYCSSVKYRSEVSKYIK